MSDLQGTDNQEWRFARLGRVTSSRVSDVMAKGRGGKPSASRTNYKMQLLCERLTGTWEDTFTNAAMLRGVEMEPVSRSAYEIETGSIVTEVGFIQHPLHEMTGTSPDGLVGDDGLVEFKNPNTAQHIACIQSGTYDKRYLYQMQHQMACTGRSFCDFASFDDRLPEPLQLFVAKVERDDKLIDDMMDEILIFLTELDKLEQEMLTKMEKAV